MVQVADLSTPKFHTTPYINYLYYYEGLNTKTNMKIEHHVEEEEAVGKRTLDTTFVKMPLSKTIRAPRESVYREPKLPSRKCLYVDGSGEGNGFGA